MNSKITRIMFIPTVLVLGAALILMLGPSKDTVAGIAGSDHDLSGKGWGTDELCIFCHAPHNAVTSVSGAPLWNHDVTASTFTVYSSDTLNATVGQPDGASKLCLSCHDGTVAIDSFGGSTGTHFMSGGENLGSDLSNDHPISFTYDAALATADGGLVTPASASFVDAGQNIPLYGAKMQCASCHDVHDDANGAFLRLNNTGSALCLSCHNK
ncbi:MAG: cytochrome c3 family protein [Deltaproteobacteria bacterium]|nr:cytochrome c3 family protein [Deltaproteobacteria bacterium]